MKDIPTPEEFEKAARLSLEPLRKLEAVRRAVRYQFDSCGLYDFFILDQIDVDFRAYIFFRTEKDLHESERNGLRGKIIDLVYSELERVGLGRRGTTRVAFEFDSDENVQKKFGGDYFLRLR